MQSRIAALIVALVCACSPGSQAASGDQVRQAGADSSFAGVQSRGRAAMGVDQYTSTHLFQPLPDGGRIELQRDTADGAGTARILAHMQEIAAAFAAGNFTVPGFVHAREVPGTAVMAARRESMSSSPSRGGITGRERTRESDHGPCGLVLEHRHQTAQSEQQRSCSRPPRPGSVPRPRRAALREAWHAGYDVAEARGQIGPTPLPVAIEGIECEGDGCGPAGLQHRRGHLAFPALQEGRSVARWAGKMQTAALFPPYRDEIGRVTDLLHDPGQPSGRDRDAFHRGTLRA